MPIYIGVSLPIGIFQGVLLTFFHEPYQNNMSTKVGSILGMCLIVLCWVVSFASIIFGIVKLCRPNISAQVRHKIMVRHVTAIAFFFIFDLYLQVGSFIVFNPDNWDGSYPAYQDAEWAWVLKIICASQGIFLPFTRLSEPYFYTILLRKTKEAFQESSCYGCFDRAHRKRQEKEERMNDFTFTHRDLSTLRTESDSSTSQSFGSEPD